MYLSELEILGFKSFASKTKFKFTTGLSAIVGPNGCGKTNIVDAIRWVLGEKKASVLRSEIMENVIFNGAKERKPQGMAEVTLKIENNKNILPTEYNEVSVSRRVFRSGESEYMLNKTICRLRDIQDLFMDTGIGSDTYSVIELKMIEALLNGKPDERRSMFEEAAGIKKYKLRRKEASKKLDALQIELDRLSDIVVEVQKQVNSLSRQAAKTRRYNKLASELKELDVIVIVYELNRLFEQVNNLSNELSQLNINKKALDEKNQNLEAAIDEIKTKIASLNIEYSQSEKELNSLLSQLSEIDKNIAVTEERLITSDTQNSKINSEIESLNKRKIQLNENIETILKIISELENDKNILKTQFDEKNVELNEFRNVLLEARSDVDSASSELINLQSKQQSLISLKNKSSDKRNSLQKKLDDAQRNLNNISQQITKLQKTLLESNNKTAGFDNEILSNEKKLKESIAETEKLQSLNNDLNIQLGSFNSELNSKKSVLSFLNSLTESEESIKFLKSTKSNFTTNEKILLAEAIGTDDEYRIAVDAALGLFGKYFVVNSQQEVFNAFEELISNKKGKAGFISLDLVEDSVKYEIQYNDTGYIAYVSEIVRCDEQLRNALRAILGKALITNTFDNAQKAIKEGIADVAITLKGEIISKSGSIKGGSIKDDEGVFVGRKERLNTLNKEIEKLSKKISSTREQIELNKSELSKINIDAIRKNLRNAEQQKNIHLKNISEQELKIKSLEHNYENYENNLKNISQELQEISSEDTGFDNQINELSDAIIQSKKIKEDLNSDLRKKEEQFHSLQNETKNFEMQIIKSESEITNKNNELNRLKSEILSADKKRDYLNSDLKNNSLNKDRLLSNLNSYETQRTVLKEKIETTRNSTSILKNDLNNYNEQFEIYRNDFNRLIKEIDLIKEKIHIKDLELNELKIKNENFSQKLASEYNIIDYTTIPIPEDFNYVDAKNSISDLKTKLISLENVNFLALEEYEQQSERLDFYNKQINDLNESKKNLLETISEINTTAETAFSKTFDAIRTNFQNLFKVLFSEDGEADIKLSDDNLLESNIEIFAKPPHKKPHSIEMLSGGEKTLTAIALLFAIYLVKPSPFCILDEVDAPLDDNNIDKFINLIKKFTSETQFLIVTHNKRTMEACDNLYGITMEEEGVSKVVTVKLDTEKIA